VTRTTRLRVPAPESVTVAELMRSRMELLRPAERRVARTLLADYPSAGLNTVADLALRAGVSAPTVVRCAHALGFEGFTSLQASLRAELTRRSNGPLAHVRPAQEPGTDMDTLVRRAEHLAQGMLVGFASIPPSDLEATVALLADTSRPLFVAGGRYTRVIAEYLALLLEQLRPRVRYLADPFGADHGQVLDLTRRDVYVLFDVKRYQRQTLALAQEIRKRGVTIILVTDEQLSPVAALADAVLPAAVSTPSADPSITAAFMLCELLVTPVLNRLGESAKTRLALWEDSQARHRRRPDELERE
jgi:DNA-binding MurR/RpiR family transcriptional regulator